MALIGKHTVDALIKSHVTLNDRNHIVLLHLYGARGGKEIFIGGIPVELRSCDKLHRSGAQEKSLIARGRPYEGTINPTAGSEGLKFNRQLYSKRTK